MEFIFTVHLRAEVAVEADTERLARDGLARLKLVEDPRFARRMITGIDQQEVRWRLAEPKPRKQE